MKRLVSLFTVLLLVFTTTAGLADLPSVDMTLGDLVVRYNELCTNDDQDIVVTMDWIHDEGMLVEYDPDTDFTVTYNWTPPFNSVDTLINTIMISRGSASPSVFLSRCDLYMQTVNKGVSPEQCRAAVMDAITAFQEDPKRVDDNRVVALCYGKSCYYYYEDETDARFVILLHPVVK